MARAYSQDLRERVIASAEAGLPARHAAERFDVGIATAIVWVRRAREAARCLRAASRVVVQRPVSAQMSVRPPSTARSRPVM